MTWNAEKATDNMLAHMGKFTTDDEMRSYVRRQLIGAYEDALRDAQDVCLAAALDGTNPIDIALAIVNLRDTV